MIVILFIILLSITVKNIKWKQKQETITMLPIMKKCKIYSTFIRIMEVIEEKEKEAFEYIT